MELPIWIALIPVVIAVVGFLSMYRNYFSVYNPESGESPFFRQRVLNPLTMDMSIWLNLYEEYFTIGKELYEYNDVAKIEVWGHKSVAQSRFTFVVNVTAEGGRVYQKYVKIYSDESEKIVRLLEEGGSCSPISH